ncbi:MAG: imidazoleglycerol-phosphate dehydratase HisB [Desulfobacteraceae bacterium]|nr:MAG: imidazoleglycerol-phosphate dehydratase HisB [Desulfobacteraceae bacterium]
MTRQAGIQRKTKETDIELTLNLDGSGDSSISTSIPFFDHMLTAFSVHGLFDLDVKAVGDIDVDMHHTVEDVGIVLGQAFSKALGDKKGISRFGEGAVPMDDALCRVNVDLSNRPYLVYHMPESIRIFTEFNVWLAKEFFQAFSVHAATNLHINALYGENDHHVIESVFKAFGRAMRDATRINPEIAGVLSSKGAL